MKKILYTLVLTLILSVFSIAYSKNEDFSGRWAEKISERVVADVVPNKDDNGYRIYITWREDNLGQKDIYQFLAKKTASNTLSYKNGIHIYRFYEKKSYIDETDYTDGTGQFILKNNELIWKDYKNKSEDTVFIRANEDLKKDTTVKNKFFSITLPRELKGFYKAKIKKDSIALYDKASEKAGFGGFTFALKIYQNPSEHAMNPGGRKIGELTDKKGKLYDMVLIQPTDVQYDYTKDEPYLYKTLYEFAEFVNPIGIEGSTYFKNQGMKGESLYKDVLKKHYMAIKEKWDSTKLEKENMSYMYNVLAKTNKNVLNKVGYAYYDVNGDGIEELFIGEISKGSFKGVAYDIYTMKDRTPIHVTSGGTRQRYFACDDSFVCEEYNAGANERGWLVYNLVENSDELFPQVGFKYDGYENKKSPWFISYDFLNDKWDNVSKKQFDERKEVFNRYQRFDYIPFSKFIEK